MVGNKELGLVQDRKLLLPLVPLDDHLDKQPEERF